MFVKSTYVFVFAIGVASVSAGLVDWFGEEEVEDTRERRQAGSCSPPSIKAASDCCQVKEVLAKEDFAECTTTPAPEAGRKRRDTPVAGSAIKSSAKKTRGKKSNKGKCVACALNKRGMLAGQDLDITKVKAAYAPEDAAKLDAAYKYCDDGIPKAASPATSVCDYRGGQVYTCIRMKLTQDACVDKTDCAAQSGAIAGCNPLTDSKAARSAKGAGGAKGGDAAGKSSSKSKDGLKKKQRKSKE